MVNGKEPFFKKLKVDYQVKRAVALFLFVKVCYNIRHLREVVE